MVQLRIVRRGFRRGEVGLEFCFRGAEGAADDLLDVAVVQVYAGAEARHGGGGGDAGKIVDRDAQGNAEGLAGEG